MALSNAWDRKGNGRRLPAMTAAAAQKKFNLTNRETDVAALVAKGFSRKMIAAELEISIWRVDDLLEKLRLKTRSQVNWQLIPIFCR